MTNHNDPAFADLLDEEDLVLAHEARAAERRRIFIEIWHKVLS